MIKVVITDDKKTVQAYMSKSAVESLATHANVAFSFWKAIYRQLYKKEVKS